MRFKIAGCMTELAAGAAGEVAEIKDSVSVSGTRGGAALQRSSQQKANMADRLVNNHNHTASLTA